MIDWLPDATRKTWRNPTTGAPYWDGGSLRDNPLLILHTTEGHQSCPGYQNSRGQAGGYAPQFTIVVKLRQFLQHAPMNRAGRALSAYHNSGIQVEITGSCSIDWAKKAGLIHVDDFTDDDIAFITKCLNAIRAAANIPAVAPFQWASYEDLATGRKKVRASAGQLAAARGVVGHQHITDNTHLDPGTLGPRLVAAMAATEAPVKQPGATGSPAKPSTPAKVTAASFDGVLGPNTIRAWQQNYINAKRLPASAADGVISSPSQLVTQVQRDLIRLGYLGKGGDDGMLGPKTQAALTKKFGAKDWKATVQALQFQLYGMGLIR